MVSGKGFIFEELINEIRNMDYKRLDEIAEKLERKHLEGSAAGSEESKGVLALTQFYRIHRALEKSSNENSGLHLQDVSGCWPKNYITAKGYCHKCEAALWNKHQCMREDECPLENGNIYTLPK